jgi:signal transduction histidine kinase
LCLLAEQGVSRLDNQEVGAEGVDLGEEVSSAGGAPTIHVDDDGSEVPAKLRQQIFERFTRLDEPRNRNVGGAGLGLAIVKQVIQSHGGTVACTDAPIGGARISMRFPSSRRAQ